MCQIKDCFVFPKMSAIPTISQPMIVFLETCVGLFYFILSFCLLISSHVPTNVSIAASPVGCRIYTAKINMTESFLASVEDLYSVFTEKEVR